jgi:MOSC domain-containing protein
MHVKELWRYPVKSMAGETILEATVLPLGIEGDRIVQVRGADGRVVTARTHPRLLGHRGSLGPDGEPLVDGRPWSDPAVRIDVERDVGMGAWLVRNTNADRFDVLPLLVATDGAIAAFGHDSRRLRPNIVVGGVAGLAERSWQGLRLQIGEVVIQIADLRGRCVMTTYDPDTLTQDPDVLNGIVRRFGGRLALNASVVRGGIIRVRDSVQLIGTAAEGLLPTTPTWRPRNRP